MNKRSFFLGLLSGIIISLVVFISLPFIRGLFSSNNSAQKIVQTFVDAVALGDRTTAVSLLKPNSPSNPGSGFSVMTPEEKVDNVLFSKGIVSVGKHVPIALNSSTEITPAMRANGISLFEIWCASFVTESEGSYQDYIVPTYVITVNGKTYIIGIDAPGYFSECSR